MNKCYIVKGATGQYEDYYEWIAKAFFNKEKADDLNGGLNVLVEGSGKLSYEEREKLEKMIQEVLDPKCSIDFGGTYYKVEELEIE